MIKNRRTAIIAGATVLILMAGGGAAYAAAASTTPTSVQGTSTVALNSNSTENSPWYDTDSNAAGSRANGAEKVLTPSTVANVEYLRSMAAPPTTPQVFCPGSVVAPVLVGGDIYAITNDELSKYDAATGSLLWRSIPDTSFASTYVSLAVSGNLVIVGAYFCDSPSSAYGELWAYNATTGALVWQTIPPNGSYIAGAVVATSYVIAAGEDISGPDVFVFNLSTGTFVWDNYGCGGSSTYVPVVVGLEVISYGCSQGNPSLQANDLATGTLRWSLSGSYTARWTIQRGDQSSSAGKHLYATNPSGTVEDLNPLTGQVEYSLSQAVTVLAVDKTRAYATCGSQGQDLCAYSTSTGALQWQDTQLGYAPALVAEAGGVLYTDHGDALNAASGQVITTIWAAATATALAVGDGRIAAVTDPRVVDLFGLSGY